MAKDVELFRAAMADVRPLRGRKQPVIPRPKTGRPSNQQEGSRPAVATTTKPSPPAPQVFDRDIDRALAKGKRTPESKLDLHGMTLIAAERAVTRFIADASEQN